jgi:galactoside O-acetyltransferase
LDDLKAKLRSAGRDVVIHQPVVLIAPERMVVRNHVIISEFAFVAAGQGLFIGNHVHIANHVSIIGGGVCIIDDFVGLCAGSRIITGTDDVFAAGIPSPTVPAAHRSFYRSYVRCCRHSFIGTNAVIHPGVTIGEGSVVGSGAVVTKDLDPWGLYIGAPARRVRDRPREQVLEAEAAVYSVEGLQPSSFVDEMRAMGLSLPEVTG